MRRSALLRALRSTAHPLLPVLAMALVAIAVAPAARAGETCDVSCAPCVAKTIENLKTRGWVGVMLDSNDDGNWVVTEVMRKSPAAGAGLKEGDVLLELEGIPYRKDTYDKLKDVYDNMVPGREITYTALRGGERLQISLTLAPLPEHMLAAWVGYRVLASYREQTGEAEAAPKE